MLLVFGVATSFSATFADLPAKCETTDCLASNLKRKIGGIVNITSVSIEILQIKIENSSLESFPAEIFLDIPQTTEIFIYNSNLIDLEPSALNNSTNLTKLSIVKNKLQKIHTNNFQFAQNLMQLELDRNEIHQIEENAFQYLNLLEILSISHNKLNFLSDFTFSDNRNLKFLDLSFNQISEIHLVFAALLKVQAIRLEFNVIKLVSRKAFAANFDVKNVNLTGNLCTVKDFDGNFNAQNSVEACYSRFKNADIDKTPSSIFSFAITKAILILFGSSILLLGVSVSIETCRSKYENFDEGQISSQVPLLGGYQGRPPTENYIGLMPPPYSRQISDAFDTIESNYRAI